MYGGMGVGEQVLLGILSMIMLAPVVDRMVIFLKQILAFLPGKSENCVTYVLLVGIAGMLCWQGHFDIFTLLGWHWWQNPWLGWLSTGAFIAGGTSLLGKQMRMVGLLPPILGGAMSSVGSMFGYGNYANPAETKTEISEEELNQNDN